ncbi:MAG: dihydroneopterin aldolase [Bacteroidales bacterium]
MAIISLEGMDFYAYHGCFREEQIIGTRFLVDLYLETNTSEAEETDKLSRTLNYQDIYLLVKHEMEQKSHLIEHVARRILDRLAETYPKVQSARIKISKMNPPLGGKVDRVSVTVTM